MSIHSLGQMHLRSTYLRLLLACGFALALLIILVSQFPASVSAQPLPPNHAVLAAPQAVGLTGFDARAKKGKVIVTWTTDNEINMMGFRVWRRGAAGPANVLTQEMIPAESIGEIAGNQYVRKDRTVHAGKTYYYQLEVVNADGTSSWTEEVKVKAKAD